MLIGLLTARVKIFVKGDNCAATQANKRRWTLSEINSCPPSAPYMRKLGQHCFR